MGVKIYKDTKVYVAAPAAVATGGPELLHQLVYRLRNDLEIDAYMFYYPPDCPKPVHQAYTKYKNPYLTNIIDAENNIFIVPEVISAVSLLNNYTKIRKVIWWLSVDNFYLTRILWQPSKYPGYWIRAGANRLAKATLKLPIFDLATYISKEMKRYVLRDDPNVSQADFHFVQSHYAQNHLMEKRIRAPVYYLSDYLNEVFLQTETDINGKEDMVVFNPLKGFKFTAELIRSAPHIRFVAIQNMTREEVVRLLQRAKVYIDFGNHPGKDRIPREAAMLRCCVITSRKGAARFKEDLGIPDGCKFETKRETISAVIAEIEDCFAHFEERLGDFEPYRDTIKKEPETFLRDLNTIFEKSM